MLYLPAALRGTEVPASDANRTALQLTWKKIANPLPRAPSEVAVKEKRREVVEEGDPTHKLVSASR
jgi:hypothetical protein